MADPEVADMFAGLKKKKKKVTLMDAPTTSSSNGDTLHGSVKETGTVEPVRPLEKDADLTLKDDEPLDFSNLKKKKKNKEVAIDLEEVATPSDGTVVDRLGSTDATGNTVASSEPAADVLEEFSGLKKKKKSKKSAFDLEAFEKELAAVEGGAPASGDGTPAAGSDDEIDGEARDVPAPDGENPFGEGQEASTDGKSKSELAADKKAWLQDPSRDYTYQELLGRFYTLLFAGNPSLSREGGKKRYTIVPPNVQREGSKRTSFANIAEICKKLRRQPEHVIQFMFAELGTSGSVDGSGRLIIKGRFQQKQIENVLRRYIVEYVNCKTCKLPDTLLTKDNRLYFVTCETCGSKQSVASIKVGFQAQTKRRPKAG